MTLLSQRREVGEFRKRTKWMGLFAAACFLLLAGRMVQLQWLRFGEYSRIGVANITKTIDLPAMRGIMRDARGLTVATNRPAFHVYVTPYLIESRDTLRQVARLMELDEQQLAAFERRLARVPRWRRTHQIEMFSDISRDQMAALETHSLELPAIDVVAVPVRTYPHGSLGAHAIGYLSQVNAVDLEKLPHKGYRSGDVIGRTGVEQGWEDQLRGVHGFYRVLIDAAGEVQDLRWRRQPTVAKTQTFTQRREPVAGHDVTLTLDMELMRAIDRALRGHPSAGAVVVEAQTGRVRALYAKPSYDPNEMSGRLTQERFSELTSNPFRPLIDKTVYESYFPGSTFKPISALAALGDGAMDAKTRIDCGGSYLLGNRRFRCTQTHRQVDMRHALTQSCNVFFYRLAEQVSLDRLAWYARELGLGERTGIGINSEASGFVPTQAWYRRNYDSRFRLGFTLNAAIGQGNTRTTLLQMAMAYAAIANGGNLYAPQLIERITAPDGRVVRSFTPRLRRRLHTSTSHLAEVVEGLYGVVHDSLGTAYSGEGETSLAAAGKTGTAQVARRAPRAGQSADATWYFNRDHAWFAGFAPVHQPEVVVVVLVEHGGAGGKTAAPIAMQILRDYFAGNAAAPALATAAGLQRVAGPRAVVGEGSGS